MEDHKGPEILSKQELVAAGAEDTAKLSTGFYVEM